MRYKNRHSYIRQWEMGFLFCFPILIFKFFSFSFTYLVYNSHVRRKKRKKKRHILGTCTIHTQTLINIFSMMVQRCFDHTSSYVQR